MRILQTKKASQALTIVVIGVLVAVLVSFFYPRIYINNSGRENSPEWVKVTSQLSLIHVGSNDSFAITEKGRQAARLVFDALEHKNLDSAKEASKIYDEIIPKENYGGEYTALQWFSQYLLGSEAERKQLLADKYDASFFDFFAANDFANLKEYLKRKYQLAKLEDQYSQNGDNRKAFLEDFILFNNPRREEWENTTKTIQSLDIKPGEKIADVGSGPGYYTFKFAELVGDKGQVFAIDTVQDHLNYVKQTAQKFGISNVKTIITQGDVIGVSENQVDLVFLCSLYHNIYGMVKEDERTKFVNSIHQALTKNGRLIVVDNALVDKGVLPYHGPYIAKELIIGQLKYYGFEFVKDDKFVPQRYVLVFKKV